MLNKISTRMLQRGLWLSRRYKAATVVSSFFLVAAAVALTMAKLPTSHVFAQVGATPTPDYSNVGNALAGTNHILRQDDIVMTYGAATDENPSLNYAPMVPITTANSSSTQNYDFNHAPFYWAQDSTITTGRFFNTAQDTVISLPEIVDDMAYINVLNGTVNNGNASLASVSRTQLPNWTNSTTITRSIAADFNQDGYDDLLITYSDYTAHTNRAIVRMRIATANNVNDSTQGFNLGAEQITGTPDSFLSTVVGDFNGDGQPDIAFASVGSDSTLNFYLCSVDPQTLQINLLTQTTVDTLPSNSQTQPVRLVAGSFTGSDHPQLIVASPLASNGHIYFRVYDFAENSYQGVLQQSWDSGATADMLKVIASKYDWGSPYDVITVAQTKFGSGGADSSSVYLLTVDPASYAITKAATVDFADMFGAGGANNVAYDIAVGNFNNQQPSPTDPTVSINNPDLQLAVAVGFDGGGGLTGPPFNLGIAQVIDPQSGAINIVSRSVSQIGFPESGNGVNKVTINAVDLQGRSMRLGAGYRIALAKNSPSLILAQPPMHVDYAPAELSSSSPTVMNLSFATDKFNSTFTKSESSDNQESKTSTKGWGFSGKESLGESFTLGSTSPEGSLNDGFKVSETFTAQQDINHSTDKKYGTSVTVGETYVYTTGNNDFVTYENGVTYIYVYEVIGRTVCPSNIPNCQPSQQVPLRVMMSAPGVTQTTAVSAEALEWYQPAWENGNILSYPGNQSQLLANVTNPLVMTKTNTFSTNSGQTTITTNWASTQNAETDISYSKVFSENSETGVQVASGEEAWGEGISEDTSLTLDFGGSDSFAGMRTSSTTISSATGITLSATAKFRDPLTYSYFYTPLIFGQNMSPSYFDGTDPKTQFSNLPPVTTSLNVFGPMRSAFTVDPLANGAGGWWAQTYRTPDVALNHPNRWSTTKPGASSPLPFNCVDSNDGYLDCVTQKTRKPADPWDDSFHNMRGFFIFKAGEASASDPGNQGLQQQIATDGDQLSLQARVYNYSLAQMPAGTTVKVRFYGMQWNSSNQLPADYVDTNNPGGASFLIGETTLNPIQPWSNTASTPNYSLATVNFDTTGRENQDIVFWVAVWMQDASGNLVTEPTGKGLTAIPSGNSPKFTDFTNLEPLTTNNWQTEPGDPAQTSFSNNIGFYRQALTILPKSTGLTAKPKSPLVTINDVVKNQQAIDVVAFNNNDVERVSIKLGESSEISAVLHNGGANLFGASVYYYDGDPDAGGKLFDVDLIARIQAGADFKVRTRFYSKECGLHQLYLRIGAKGVLSRAMKAARAIQVECPTAVCTVQTCMKSPQYYSLNTAKLPNGMVAIPSGRTLTNVSTGNTTAIKLALKGGNAASQFFKQQYVALQLNLLAANDPSRQAEQSNLLCYKVNFQPVQLKSGTTLHPGMKIAELLKEARLAVQKGDAIDLRTIANVMQLLNGNDPSGRCK